MLGFHSENQAPPAKNGIATITIKSECLVYSCVEQDSWMYYTSWFELHRSQDECFSALFTRGPPFCCVLVRGVSIMIAVAL